MKKNLQKWLAVLLVLGLVLPGCGNAAPGAAPPKKAAGEETPGTEEDEGTAGNRAGEEDAESGEYAAGEEYGDDEDPGLSPEEMDLVKYNYYVELNNDIIDIMDDIGYYFTVVDYTEEFSLLPDSGYTYGYRVYGKNSDIIEDCLLLADMDPSYGELDELVKEMADPLRELMDTFLAISGSHDYADNQYRKAKEYHAVIYEAANAFASLGYEYIDAISEMGEERIALEEEQMKEDGELIAYNASRGLSIGRKILNEIYGQGITDETITDLDLTEIKILHDELVEVVADLDAATADNNQLIKESLSNSRPFDGLYDSLIQALEWMIKQVESGQPLDLSGSGAPLGSIGHFTEVFGKCVDRYNSVFVE